MLSSGISSKPVYQPCQPDRAGKCHLLVAQGEGGEVLQRLLAEFGDEPQDISLYYSKESSIGREIAQKLLELPTSETRIYDRSKELLHDFAHVLASAKMGTRLYIAGSEPFIWSVSRLAQEHGLTNDEIQREQADSRARHVYCVHCKAIAEEVATNIVQCPQCQLHLLVRDHFSRRLNAYMGVCVDAEKPGERPAVAEVFSHGR